MFLSRYERKTKKKNEISSKENKLKLLGRPTKLILTLFITYTRPCTDIIRLKLSKCLIRESPEPY